jgi:zinc transport system substrate-binding protein
LITFHNGFSYFAEAFGLNMLCSIEEEEGSEASAEDITKIIGLVREYHIPAIFCEVNGSDSTAQAIARETGIKVYRLSTLMAIPDNWGLEGYEDLLTHDVDVILQAMGGGA